MKKISTIIKLALTVLFIAATQLSFAQCRNIAKKCLPDMTPYIYTGQLNSVEMAEGESAELGMTFYTGQEYRVIICGSSVLGDINFNILDKDRKSIFSNKDHKNSQSWDFKVNSTDEYTVEIIVPKNKSYKVAPISGMGCVAVLVGFKKP